MATSNERIFQIVFAFSPHTHTQRTWAKYQEYFHNVFKKKYDKPDSPPDFERPLLTRLTLKPQPTAVAAGATGERRSSLRARGVAGPPLPWAHLPVGKSGSVVASKGRFRPVPAGRRQAAKSGRK